MCAGSGAPVSFGEFRKGITLHSPGNPRRTEPETWLESGFVDVVFRADFAGDTDLSPRQRDGVHWKPSLVNSRADRLMCRTVRSRLPRSSMNLTLVTRNVKDFAGLGVPDSESVGDNNSLALLQTASPNMPVAHGLRRAVVFVGKKQNQLAVRFGVLRTDW